MPLVETNTVPSDGVAAPCPVAWTATDSPSLVRVAHRGRHVCCAAGRDHDRRAMCDGRVESGYLGGGGRVLAVEDRPGHLACQPFARQ